MKLFRTLSLLLASALFLLPCAGPLRAEAPCGGDFDTWISEFKREAAAQGISGRAIAASLDGLAPDPEYRGPRRQTFGHAIKHRLIGPTADPSVSIRGATRLERRRSSRRGSTSGGTTASSGNT